MEQAMYIFNWYLCHKEKVSEKNIKSKSRYNDISCNRMVWKTQYNNKSAISIANLVGITWIYRYPRPMEIFYDQWSELIGNEFRKFLIEK